MFMKAFLDRLVANHYRSSFNQLVKRMVDVLRVDALDAQIYLVSHHQYVEWLTE